MVDAVVDPFDVAEHHGCGGVLTEFVSDAHNGEPGVGGAFSEADLFSDGFGKDFTTPTGEGIEACVDESFEDVFEFCFEVVPGRIEESDEFDELGRAEGVDVHVRTGGFYF